MEVKSHEEKLRASRIHIIDHRLQENIKGWIMEEQILKLSVYNVLKYLSNVTFSFVVCFIVLFLNREENSILLPWKYIHKNSDRVSSCILIQPVEEPWIS